MKKIKINIFSAMIIVATMYQGSIVTQPAGTARDVRIQELEEKITQKELELSNFGNMIAQKDKQLSESKSDFRNLIESLIYKRIEQLEAQNGGKLLSQEDKDNIDAQMRKKVRDFLHQFFDDLQKNNVTEGALIEDLFQHDKSDCDLVKFYYVRLALEQEYIWHLVKKYENCIKECSALINELIDFKKQYDL